MLNIRKIKTEDLSRCASMLERVYSRPPYDEKFSNNNSFRYIKSKFDLYAEHSFVIEEDRDIVGFIFVNLSHWTQGAQAIIEEIVVDEGRQRQGYGKKLMDYIENYLKEMGVLSMMLWVKKGCKAFQFHKKNGFTVIDDYTMMHKDLK